MKKTLLTITTIVSSCFFAIAQVNPPLGGGTGPGNFTPLTNLIGKVQDIFDRLIPFTISLAVVGLFWFMLVFIWKGADNPEERKKAREGVMWSIAAIFIMFAIWGIIKFIAYSLGIGLGGDMQEFVLPGA